TAGRPRLPREPARAGRALGPPEAPPVGALRRAAAARRDRAGARVEADDLARRRAHREPGLHDRPRDPRPASRGDGGLRADARHGHPRLARGGDRGPRPLPRGRPHRRLAPAERARRDPRGDEPDQPVTKVALRGLLGRKLRSVLTAFAIVLGVAMVSGTFVLTDSIDSAFD